MSLIDHLVFAMRAARANLWNAFRQTALPEALDQAAVAGPGSDMRERVASSYQARLQQVAHTRDRMRLERAKHTFYALTWAVAFAVCFFLRFDLHLLSTGWTALALAPLVPASFSLDRASRCRRRAEQLRSLFGHYTRRLERVRHEWIGKGDPGVDLRLPGHINARDLDLFGDGSLFELLCDVDTPAGRETLAKWLQSPVSRAEAIRRQDSIRDLRDRVDLRERLALLREGEASEYSWRILREWLAADPACVPPWAPASALLLPLALIVAVACWAAGVMQPPMGLWVAGGIALTEGGLALLLGGRVRSILAELHLPTRKVESLRRLCTLVKGEDLESPQLVELQKGLDRSEARIASLRRLARLLAYRESEWTVWPFLLLMGTTQTAFAIERWRQRHGRELVEWIARLGEFEALMAIAAYAYENPDDPFPEFTGDGPRFEAADLGHPLIDPQTCVRNDVRLGDYTRFLLVTGSNMSGKSTLLRSVGLNATLAQMGAPVRARQLHLSELQVCASIRIEDSLVEGASHFYAEVERLKAILDRGRSGPPVLFLIDELFAGTNSSDRRIAAEAVIRSLARRQAIGLVTSHDMALSEIAEMKELNGANVHFTDLPAAEGELAFDYRLRPGKLTHGNALKIIELVGLLRD